MREKKKGRSRISNCFVFVPAAGAVAPLTRHGGLTPHGRRRREAIVSGTDRIGRNEEGDDAMDTT